MIEAITHKKLIRENLRYATFSGIYNGEKVFIKTATGSEQKDGVKSEVDGLKAMRALDPTQTHYLTPKLLHLSEDTIVTTWADGELMAKGLNQYTAEPSFKRLANLYHFIDKSSVGGIGTTRFNRPGQDNGVEKTMLRLRELEYQKHIDRQLVARTAEYALSVVSTIQTRFTHGDLQPGNIIISPNDNLWVIDCESCDQLWPRHYNLINFVFNYGAQPSNWLKDSLSKLFDHYFLLHAIDPNEILNQINFSAAMRCLQSINEQLGDHTEPGKDALPSHIYSYLTASMKLITDGQLFVNALSNSTTR
jgi:predicted Ser/Thr protein kinase